MALRTLAVSTVLLITMAASGRAQDAPRADQEVLADRVIDHGWGLQLARPEGTTWRVLGEAAARRVHAQAVAGFLDTDHGIPVVLVVTPGEGPALEAARGRMSAALPDRPRSCATRRRRATSPRPKPPGRRRERSR